jgi:cytochrome c
MKYLNLNKLLFNILVCIIVVIFLVSVVVNRSLFLKPSESNGKDLYVKLQCISCHGDRGQGGNLVEGGGPPLALNKRPLSIYLQQLRNPRLNMPPYSETQVSDNEIADIHSYINTLDALP